jgi:RimJ/RimL family protein N-acetyltransferase
MNIIKDNLTIRNATARDAEQLAAWWNNGAVMAHAGFPRGLSTTPENTDSLRFHLKIGFEEVGHIICFQKDLEG